MEVKIAEKEREITSQIRNLLLIITFATLIVVLFGFALSYFSAKSIAEPIRVLIQTIKEIDLKALSTTRVELKGSHETEELGGIFNNMIESLSDSVEKLKHTTAEKERIESELHIAREIQMSIIPKIFPAFPERSEFDIYGKLESARAVGGDLFDYMFIDEDQLCFTIGDVSGKGVPASLFMAITSTLVRAEAVGDMPVSEIVDGINSALCVNNDMAMFVTLFMAILNVRTGEMEYCNAGHNPPYLIKNQKEIVKLTDIHGIPVAISENIKYRSSKITINPSDSIVLYTDGVTDADNIEKDFFQEEGLETVLKKSCNLSPKGITDAIFSEVHKFAGDVNQSDDITILALKYKGDSK
jgi:sigma-B regulation protein RsbU (phosphoserine phosphatase)